MSIPSLKRSGDANIGLPQQKRAKVDSSSIPASGSKAITFPSSAAPRSTFVHKVGDNLVHFSIPSQNILQGSKENEHQILNGRVAPLFALPSIPYPSPSSAQSQPSAAIAVIAKTQQSSPSEIVSSPFSSSSSSSSSSSVAPLMNSPPFPERSDREQMQFDEFPFSSSSSSSSSASSVPPDDNIPKIFEKSVRNKKDKTSSSFSAPHLAASPVPQITKVVAVPGNLNFSEHNAAKQALEKSPEQTQFLSSSSSSSSSFSMTPFQGITPAPALFPTNLPFSSVPNLPMPAASLSLPMAGYAMPNLLPFSISSHPHLLHPLAPGYTQMATAPVIVAPGAPKVKLPSKQKRVVPAQGLHQLARSSSSSSSSSNPYSQTHKRPPNISSRKLMGLHEQVFDLMMALKFFDVVKLSKTILAFDGKVEDEMVADMLYALSFAHMYTKSQSYSQIITILKKAILLYPENHELKGRCYWGIVKCLMAQGSNNYDEMMHFAMAAANILVNHDSIERGRTFLALVYLHMQRGDLERAKSYCVEGLKGKTLTQESFNNLQNFLKQITVQASQPTSSTSSSSSSAQANINPNPITPFTKSLSES